MSNERRHILVKDNEHLLLKVDLGVVLETTRGATWSHHQRLLHSVPQGWSHHSGCVLARHPHHQFFVRPHGLLCQRANDPVDRTWIESDIGKPLLHHFNVFSGGSAFEIA